MESEIYCDQCCEGNVKYDTLIRPVVLSGCESLTHKNGGKKILMYSKRWL